MSDIKQIHLALALAAVMLGMPAQAAASTPDQVVVSWQVQHPVATGVLSGFTFGAWPGEYGGDAERKKAVWVQNQGLGRTAFEYVRRHNENIFRFSRKSTYLLLIFIAAVATVTFVRSRKRPQRLKEHAA